MAVTTYGNSVLSGAVIDVLIGDTNAISLAFNSRIGIVGEMDTSGGSATEGSVVDVPSSSDAQTLFGDNSHLHKAVKTAYANGIADIKAIPITETTGTTESFAGTSSGTLTNAPVMDPNVTTNHTISAQDTVEAASVTVNIVYDVGTPSAPTSSNEMNLNPISGEWAADASSDYDITIDHGDWTSAIQTMAAESDVRGLAAINAAESVSSDLVTELGSRAQNNLDFKFGVSGAMPNISDPSTFTDGIDDFRAIRCAASRGWLDSSQTEEASTAAAVAAKFASQELGGAVGGTDKGELAGFDSLRTSYSPTDVSNLHGEQITAVMDNPNIHVEKGLTTSTKTDLDRVFKVEILDEATEVLNQISNQFDQSLNVGENREDLRDQYDTGFSDMESDNLLDDYSLTVTEGSADNEVDVTAGVDLVDAIDTININLSVGDVIRNNGVS